MATRGTKRTLVKRSTSLNLYTDQAIQIQALMEAAGSRKEAPLVRQLLDEALAARRRKSVNREVSEQPPPSQDLGETLQTIQTLLLKMIRQGETSLRAQGISLILVQEVLAEASAGRKIAWNRLEAPALRDAGVNSSEIEERFHSEASEAKDYAYGVAEEIRSQQERQTHQKTGRNAPDELPFE